MKKTLITLVLITGACFILSSCLKHGLDPLPSFTDATIQRFDFEYRWNNNGKFAVVTFNTGAPIVSNDTIYVTTTVPAQSGDFTPEIRTVVTNSELIAYCNLATAATIQPIDGAPELGKPGDFSKPSVYQVTAADGKTVKTWVLVVRMEKP